MTQKRCEVPVFLDIKQTDVKDLWSEMDLVSAYPVFGFYLNKTGRPMVYCCSWAAAQIVHNIQVWSGQVLFISWSGKLLTVLYLHCNGLWGTTGDFTTSFLHFPLFSTTLLDLANSWCCLSTSSSVFFKFMKKRRKKLLKADFFWQWFKGRAYCIKDKVMPIFSGL